MIALNGVRETRGGGFTEFVPSVDHEVGGAALAHENGMQERVTLAVLDGRRNRERGGSRFLILKHGSAVALDVNSVAGV